MPPKGKINAPPVLPGFEGADVVLSKSSFRIGAKIGQGGFGLIHLGVFSILYFVKIMSGAPVMDAILNVVCLYTLVLAGPGSTGVTQANAPYVAKVVGFGDDRFFMWYWEFLIELIRLFFPIPNKGT